jgi:hypothetical protein
MGCRLWPGGKPLRASFADLAAMLSPRFLEELHRLGRQIRATNMTLEGELSANKAAAPSTRKAVGAERLAYVGHSYAGFVDPPLAFRRLSAFHLCFGTGLSSTSTSNSQHTLHEKPGVNKTPLFSNQAEPDLRPSRSMSSIIV